MKKKCIISDIDGTVALMGSKRTPFEYHKAFWDLPNKPVIDVLRATHSYYTTHYKTQVNIIFTSARENVVFDSNNTSRSVQEFKDIAELTETWVAKHIGISSELCSFIFREAGNYQCDRYVKYDIGKKILEEYDVLCVFDDRDRVVNMWRHGLKLQCFQVADGKF